MAHTVRTPENRPQAAPSEGHESKLTDLVEFMRKPTDLVGISPPSSLVAKKTCISFEDGSREAERSGFGDQGQHVVAACRAEGLLAK